MGGFFGDQHRCSAVDELNRQVVCDTKVSGYIFCAFFEYAPSWDLVITKVEVLPILEYSNYFDVI